MLLIRRSHTMSHSPSHSPHLYRAAVGCTERTDDRLWTSSRPHADAAHHHGARARRLARKLTQSDDAPVLRGCHMAMRQ